MKYKLKEEYTFVDAIPVDEVLFHYKLPVFLQDDVILGTEIVTINRPDRRFVKLQDPLIARRGSYICLTSGNVFKTVSRDMFETLYELR